MAQKPLPSNVRPDTTLEFLRLLWSIEHSLQRISKRMESSHGVTGPQRLVLRLLRTQPHLSARELASLVFLHPSTVTGILQRLEKKGMIRRERDAADNRRVKLRVAARATRIVDRPGTIEGAIKTALSSVSAAQVKSTRMTLAHIARVLEGSGTATPAVLTRLSNDPPAFKNRGRGVF
jgi:DNA-binding MarR family transcriptional regulator